jgi:hypothetical protein
MIETELLRTIRPIWLHRVTLSIGKGAGVREDLRAQLERFFELLVQVVDTGDPAWMDSILSSWASSLTQSDLEGGQSNLMPFLKEIMQHTNQICRETLDGEQAWISQCAGALLCVCL